MTEIEFLNREAGLARAEMQRQLHQISQRVQQEPRLQRWTNEHPWLTTGAAAAAGVIVGRMVAGRVRSRDGDSTSAAGGWGGRLLGGWLKSIVAGPMAEIMQTILASLAVALSGSRAASGHDGGEHPTRSTTEPPPGPTT